MTSRVFLITGASSGIGAATARAAAKAGFRLVLAARRVGKLDALAHEIGTDRVLTVSCDVTSMADQQAMVEQALARFDQIDVVFANAGRGGSPGGFSGADHEQWKDMILTNIYGVGLTLQTTLAALKQSHGHVLLTGSAAGRAPIAGSMYGATKWAVTGMGYNLREELRGTGVRVTLIEPGMVDTPFFDKPPAHAMKDDDIANAVLYAVNQPAHVDVNEILLRPTPPLE